MFSKIKNIIFISSIAFKIVKCVNSYDHCINPGDIALTFNGCPSLEFTNVILDILDKENVKATFFINGENCNLKNNHEAKKILQKEYENGHIIANNAFNHPVEVLSQSTNEQFKKEVNELNNIIYDIIGVKPAFYRPYDKYYHENLKILEECHMSANIICNLDSEDLNLMTNPLNQYIKILGISDRNINSFIALNHDTSRSTIKEIISYVKSLGYRFVPMDECIGLNPYQNTENNGRSEIINSEYSINKNYNALLNSNDDSDELIYITMDNNLMDDTEYTTFCMTYDDGYPTNDDHADEYVTSCSVYDVDDDDDDDIITTTTSKTITTSKTTIKTTTSKRTNKTSTSKKTTTTTSKVTKTSSETTTVPSETITITSETDISIAEYSEIDDGNKNNEIDNSNKDDVENGSIKTYSNYTIIILIISFIYLIF